MLFEPTPEAIKAARLRAGLTQTEAANLVHAGCRTWQQWEEIGTTRPTKMHLAFWELFLIKTGQHKIKVKK